MPSTYTISSGSGRSGSERVVIYPERTSNSSRSASVHSPASSDDRSFTSSNDSEEWTHLDRPYDDGIEPSDSASRAKQSRSRRHNTEARPAPTRRHSSRRLPHQDREREREREELPRHQSSSHRPRERRHHRAESRRTTSDESSSTVASADDYPYSHHGMPPPQQRSYPPQGGYRQPHAPQPPHSHGGYPPSMTGASGYPDPFQAQAQALVHMPHQGQDPFGYPSSNPFSPGAGPTNNPFSPMGAPGAPDYFPNPHAPPPMQQHMQQHQQRPPGPSHRGSMYAPSSVGYPGTEMVASPYQHPGMAGMAQGMYPGYPMQPYQQMPYMYPPSHSTSPPPAPVEEKKKEPEVKEVVVEVKDDSAMKELENLRELIKKHESDRIAREAAIIAQAEAEKAAAAAEKKKQAEIAAASAAAKAKAEKAADEVAKKAKEESDAKLKEAEEAFKKAKEESDKKLADAEKAKADEEKKKKELEDEIEKNKPLPDLLCKPIKFKDAVGRKFSFPWHLCKTWKGMETLIKQAFLHVDLIGKHVQDGHYDLTGPDGEIILPQVWDTMIKPDWEVSMHMWPMPEPEKKPKKDKLADDAAAAAAAAAMHDFAPDPFAGLGLQDILGLDVGQAPAPAKKGDKKVGKKAKRASAVIDVPVMQGGQMPMAPPPPNFPPGFDPLLFPPGGPMAQPMVQVMADEKKAKAKAKAKSKEITGLAAWIAGASGSRPAKKDDEKHELVRHRSATSSTTGSASHKGGPNDQSACAVM